MYPNITTSPKKISSIVPDIPSTKPNYVSIPNNKRTEKNIIHHKLGRGIEAKIAGYKTNAKSGPDN